MDTSHAFARGSLSAAVLVDLNGDGKLEIVISAFDGQLHAFKLDGSEIDGFPVLLHSTKTMKYNRIISTPAVSDFNGDGVPDLLSGSNETVGGGGNAGPVFMVDGHGTKAVNGPYLPDWPVTITSLSLIPVIAEGVGPSPAAGDFDGDGRPDAIVQGTGGFFVLQADPGVQSGFGDPPNTLPITTDAEGKPQQGFDPSSIFGENSQANRPDTFFPALSSPAVGDLDQDGTPDLIISGDTLSFAGSIIAGSGNRLPLQHLLTMWNGKTGHMFDASPIVIEDVTFLVNPIVADVSGDGYPEVLVGTGAYFLHAADACGREPAGWPKLTNGWIMSTSAVGDLDGDHKLEAVSATREGNLYVWHTNGRDDGAIEWESFHHDNQNTGDFGRKLDQGTVHKATSPIDCSAPPPPPAVETYDAGGCAIAMRDGESESRAPWIVIAGVVLAVITRLARRARAPATTPR
jgi:hypothetical protein